MRVDSTGFGASGPGSKTSSGRDGAPPSEPPLYDPYFGGGGFGGFGRDGEPGAPTAGAAAGPGASTAVRVGTATWSLVLGALSLVLGLLTGPLAVLLGVIGLRKARMLAAEGWDARSPRLRARLGIAFAATALTVHAALFAYGLHRYREQKSQVVEAQLPAPLPDRVPMRRVDPDGPIPATTEEVEIGRIRVVTLGAREASLRAALTREAGAAKSQGQEMLVVVIDANCEPCDGLQASLRDPRMQEVLKAHRLVFVYKPIFASEIVALGMDPVSIAGFYLFEPDLTVRDAIHGGEWGEDIATNIVPVLGPFLRGELVKRRYDWRAASAFPEMDLPAPGPRLPPSSRPAQPAPQPPGAVWL